MCFGLLFVVGRSFARFLLYTFSFFQLFLSFILFRLVFSMICDPFSNQRDLFLTAHVSVPRIQLHTISLVFFVFFLVHSTFGSYPFAYTFNLFWFFYFCCYICVWVFLCMDVFVTTLFFVSFFYLHLVLFACLFIHVLR